MTGAVEEGGFSRRTVAWLVAIGAVSFACAVLFAIFGQEVSTTSSAAPDTFSRSAIGHHAFVELLRREKVPVLVSQHDTGAKLTLQATLVVAEPVLPVEQGERAGELRRMIGAAERAIIVLPKWFGVEDAKNPAFLERAYLLPADEVEPVVHALGLQGGVVRLPATAPGTPPRPYSSAEDLRWGGLVPDLVRPQLLEAWREGLEPVMWNERGVLISWMRTEDKTELWIVSDPDLLSNHGLLRGDNAALALALVDRVRDGHGVVVFDETMHGFRSEPSPWRVLFEFPLALATIQALLAVGLLLWAATGRFGKPVTGADSALAPGKEFLIDNTAALLRFGGHSGGALLRYLQTTAQDAARALHAPANLDEAATARWLDELAGARGLAIRLADLEDEAGEAAEARTDRNRRVVDAARRIHRWRQEMTHGSGDSSRHR
jgi:hypothetical protein